ncbi:sperm-associated antigen 5 isoform X2 [Astyanax mexicanus]|uniref:Sperm-associated antigen 5 isoform X2 n=1 Tax=Astyanax mexicanus TaxID=7994 RepID=A0A8T2M433_ASTMX|nr:sperm-associated antigen 5 isoform X2 [Astyanax mexicanus]
MSTPRGQQSLMRLERTPLRELQNENQQQQKIQSVKTLIQQEKNTDQTENKSENLNPTCGSIRRDEPTDTAVINLDGSVTFRSLVCTGGEVELSEGSEMSDVSALIGALSLEDDSGPESLNNTTVTYGEDQETMMTSGQHADHPYCQYKYVENVDISAVLSSTEHSDITFKSFTCPGGEIEVEFENGSIIQDIGSVLVLETPLGDPSKSFGNETELSEESTELPVSPSRHIDHLYCDNSKKCPIPRVPNALETIANASHVQNLSNIDVSTVGNTTNLENADFSAVLSSIEREDITFKSFTCPGGEIEVEDEVEDGSVLVLETPIGDPSQSFGNETKLSEESTELPVSPSRHIDHLYCDNSNKSPIPRVPDAPETIANARHVQNLSRTDISAALGQLVEEHGDVMLKSLNFSGLEVEIENTLSTCSESEISMQVKNLAVDGHPQSFSSGFNGSEEENDDGGSSRALSLEHKHEDHLYCGPTNSPVSEPTSEPVSETQDLSRLQHCSPVQLESSETGESQSLNPELEDLLVPEEMIGCTDLSNQKQNSSQLYYSENKGQDNLNQQSTSTNDENEAKEDLRSSSYLLTHDSVEVQSEICPLPAENEGIPDSQSLEKLGETELNAHVSMSIEHFVVESGSSEVQNLLAQSSESSFSKLKAGTDAQSENSSPRHAQETCDQQSSSSPSEENRVPTRNNESSQPQTSVPTANEGFGPESANTSAQNEPAQNFELSRSQVAVGTATQDFGPELGRTSARNTESSSSSSSYVNHESFGPESGKILAQNTKLSHSQADVAIATENCVQEPANTSAQNVPAQNSESFKVLSAELSLQVPQAAVELEASGVRDSALGLSGVHSGSEVLRAESVQECLCDAVPLHSQLWSALTLQDPSTPRNKALNSSALQGPDEGNMESRLWPELPDSPLPPPQFNSTAFPLTPTPIPKPNRRDARVQDGLKGAGVRQKEKVAALDFSSVGKGPLQQQLQQMAELLILASGKIIAPATPVLPAQRHAVAVGTTPVGRHSAAAWTTPVQRAERSVNTSALVEVVKQTEVSDASTSTDPLLWSVSSSSLQALSRAELEQKMFSTLIMVEVLSQQLSSTQTPTSGTGPAPSQLRDRHAQTELTQLSQTGPYRELYVSALDRISALEEDQNTLQSLHLAIQQMRSTMTSVKTDTEEALISLRQVEGIVTEDQEVLYKQVGEMKALYARCMGTVRKMAEKCRACLQERDSMRRSMEEALQERQTVLRVLDQLRVHHSEQVSDLQRSLGSQQELTAALTHTYPQLVELKRAYVESLSAASVLLREKLQDHDQISAELCKAQLLLRKSGPVVQRLQQRAAAAVEQSRLYRAERDRATEDRAQMEAELQQVHSSLLEADQQISDLNTQITIMNSEMAVLREQLGEVEEERVQLQRKSTELSATVSSTLASYAFLEQALASETSKLQRSLHDTQEATERADSLQAEVEASGRRLEELEEALAQRDALLTELHTETENQRLQLRRLTQIQTELCSTREMSEFLQAENELTREQLTESEGLLRSHLQGLRERNLECEDLRLALQQLRAEKNALQEELVSTQDNARSMLLEQGAQLAQATLDVSLLQHRLQCLISSTVPPTDKSSDPPVQDEQQLQLSQKPQSSFVGSIMMALSAEPENNTPAVCTVEEDEPVEGIGSKSSAFTRLSTSAAQHDDDVIRSTTLVDLLGSLGDSMSELQSAIEQQNQDKDSQFNSLQSNIRDLQETLQKESHRNKVAEAELKQQVIHLKTQVEKDAQVLHQKTQDEKALRKLCSELEENMEAASKFRAENNELRREGAELRRMLQQSQVEVQALRAALTRSGDQSAASSKELDDRIRLLREVEKLKAKLSEVEESRSKLLERAKRHQMVHTMNQSKLERELHLLDDMIEAVRKALSSVPEVVRNCPELQKLVKFLG